MARGAPYTDPRAHCEARVDGWRFWDVLADRGLTLLVTREYEHLVMALTGRQRVHGRASCRSRTPRGWRSTRRPSGCMSPAPATPTSSTSSRPREGPEASMDRRRARSPAARAAVCDLPARMALPARPRTVAGVLHGNAVGHNAVVRWRGQRVGGRWWPGAIERDGGQPDFSRNYLQLNSIAAGETVDHRSSRPPPTSSLPAGPAIATSRSTGAA